MARTSDPTSDRLPERFDLVAGDLTVAGLRITFHRTLRVGDEGANALPPGLGRFDLRSVRSDDPRVPEGVRAKGGVLLPMYVREAMWMSFDADEPMAVQIGTGGICVLTGRDLDPKLKRRPQNYVVATEQPWLDGYKTATGEVRQFVGVPSGSGWSVEEQLAPGRSVGGLQIQVWRLTDEALQRWREARLAWFHGGGSSDLVHCCAMSEGITFDDMPSEPLMEFGAGGRIVQEVYRDDFTAKDWRRSPAARVWVHPVSIPAWCAWTGEPAPPTPIDTEAYVRAGLPWFDWYDDAHEALAATGELAGVRSVGELSASTESHHVSVESSLVRLLGDHRPVALEPGSWTWTPE
jgi:hypothetical protein